MPQPASLAGMLRTQNTLIEENKKDLPGMPNTQADFLRKIKAPTGMLNTPAEFLSKIKAPAGMHGAYPCLMYT